MTNNTENPIIKISEHYINGIARFAREDLTMGWIKEDGTILAEGFYYVLPWNDPVYWGGVFKRVDGTWGNIDSDGVIADIEWLDYSMPDDCDPEFLIFGR